MFKGIAIASHIDREGFGIIGQLGLIPSRLNLDALEFSHMIELNEARNKFCSYTHIPWVSFSDAHRVTDIGRRTTGLLMYHSTFEELCLTLKGLDSRKVIL